MLTHPTSLKIPTAYPAPTSLSNLFLGITGESYIFHTSVALKWTLKGSVHSEFLIFVMIKCVFLTDLRSKTMTCYTFSVSPTIKQLLDKVESNMQKYWACDKRYWTRLCRVQYLFL